MLLGLVLLLLLGGLGFDPVRSLLFVNITTWGSKAASTLTANTFKDDLVLLAEHHMKEEKIQRMVGHARRQNWQAVVSPARKKGRGTTGGEAIFYRQHLDVRPAPLPVSLPTVGRGFAMAVWRLRRCEVLVVTGYVRPWVTDEAKTVWRAMAARIHTMGLPVLLAGDWNMEKERLMATGWPGKLGLVPIQTTPSEHPTCTLGGQGAGTAIDYFLVSEAIAELVVRSEVVKDLGFRPHYGVRLFFRGRPRDLWRRQLRVPRPWPGHDDMQHASTVKMEALPWAQAACTARPPSWKQLGAEDELRAHLTHWPESWVNVASGLSDRAVSWSAAAEQQLCSMLGAVDGRHLGRGRAPIFEWRRVVAVRPQEALGFDGSLLFAVTVLSARLQELVAVVAAQSCGTFLCQGLLRFLRGLHLPDELANEKFGELTWGSLIKRPLALPRGVLDRAAEAMRLKAEALEKKVARDNKLKFGSWVEEAVNSPKLAHRWCKQSFCEEDLLAQQQARGRGHLAAMDDRVEFWRSRWQRHVGAWPDLVCQISDLRQQVADDIRSSKVDLIDADQLNMAIAEHKPGKAKGVDGWSTALLGHLGNDARDDLLELLRACERSGMWPVCWMATLAKFIPKPDGGERPILLLSLFYRLWIKARGAELASWEEEKGSPYDRALQGSSALRAALARAMRMEAAVASDKQAAVLMCDMEKFYDNVDLGHLISLATEVGYPRLLLLMGVLQYISPRFCSAGGHTSEAVTIYGSIAPGCGQAVGMTRPLLHAILEWAGCASPLATLESYVDDLVMVVISPSVHAVASTAVRLGQALWGRLCEIGCLVSNKKSKFVCSSKAMADAIQDMMLSKGWVVSITAEAKDLGVDMAAARKRCVKVQKVRLDKFRRRAVKVGRLARTCARARALHHQAQPQATWGQEVMGLSPTMLQALRRDALRATGMKTKGMCTTMALAAVFGWRRDPAITTVLAQVAAWIGAWRCDERLREEVRAAWPRILFGLSGTRPWATVKGPAAALVLTLRRYGWEAVGPDHWVDPRGTHWQPTFEPTNLDLFLDELAIDIETVLWSKAADHWQGLGLEQGGVDQWVMQRALARTKSKDLRKYHMMIRILAGGCWPKFRCHQLIADRPSPVCPRCGAAAETDFHRWWECPSNDALKDLDPEAFGTQAVLHAFRYASEYPCFVSRGILPADLTATPSPPESARGIFYPALSEEGGRRTWATRRDAYTDGSGGEHSADPRLRRCGWGFVVLAPPLGWASDEEDSTPQEGEDEEDVKVEFAGQGPLPGRVQKVGRAELMAAIHLLRATAGPVTLYSDYKILVDGFAAGPATTRSSRMADLWEQLWEAMDTRPGGRAHVTICKVKAHVPEEVVRSASSPLSLRHWHGNRLADDRANEGAAGNQLPTHIVDRVRLHTNMADLFLRRMVIILEAVVLADESVDRPPRALPTLRGHKRKRQLTRAILASGHQLVRRVGAGGIVRTVCIRCFAVRRCGQGLLPWLRARPCQGAPPAGGRPVAVCPLAHPTHQLHLHGEVAICGRCGCYACFGNGIRKLRHPCTGRPARRMAENMRNLAKGKHPHGGPLRELGMDTLLELDCLVV